MKNNIIDSRFPIFFGSDRFLKDKNYYFTNLNIRQNITHLLGRFSEFWKLSRKFVNVFTCIINFQCAQTTKRTLRCAFDTKSKYPIISKTTDQRLCEI